MKANSNVCFCVCVWCVMYCRQKKGGTIKVRNRTLTHTSFWDPQINIFRMRQFQMCNWAKWIRVCLTFDTFFFFLSWILWWVETCVSGMSEWKRERERKTNEETKKKRKNSGARLDFGFKYIPDKSISFTLLIVRVTFYVTHSFICVSLFHIASQHEIDLLAATAA